MILRGDDLRFTPQEVERSSPPQADLGIDGDEIDTIYHRTKVGRCITAIQTDTQQFRKVRQR